MIKRLDKKSNPCIIEKEYISSGEIMKAIFIGNRKLREIDLLDPLLDEEFYIIMNEYSLMESHIIYFSAGESTIKEIMLRKEPAYSV